MIIFTYPNFFVSDIMKNMDVNTRDSSYQYQYKDYPTCPRPLLAAVWEINSLDMVNELMCMHPDSSVPFRFEPEAHHTAKPLFFYVSNFRIYAVCFSGTMCHIEQYVNKNMSLIIPRP